MIKAKLYSSEGKDLGDVSLQPELFSVKINDALLWESVKVHLANQRQGTSQGKGRSEVSGTTRKPWKQKGTGNARAGSNKSPLWVRGGKVFHPHPIDHRLKLPKKKKALALRSALSFTAAENRLRILDNFGELNGKTNQLTFLLQNMGLSGKKNLIVVNAFNSKFVLASRNIRNLTVCRVTELNAYTVLNADYLVLMKDALSALEQKSQQAQQVKGR